MSDTDTIVAMATPPGRGGIGIVRISGPQAPDIARALLGELPAARLASRRIFVNAQGEPLDEGLALYFPAPHSFTGEHIIELHGHGGPVVMDLLVQRVLELGARAARPGEFTQRAFLNDKLDLAQAEAVADLIDSGSAAAARAALRSLRGAFSTQVHALLDALIEARLHVEAAIDFPEEEIDFLEDEDLARRLQSVRDKFAALTHEAKQGQLLRDGLTVVIAGAPNAGKSSLLNRLAGYDAAIVTAIPGTTRDILRERIDIDGLPLHVLDTAGLRDIPDEVEAEGIRRARHEMGSADLILFVADAAADPDAAALAQERARLPAGVPLSLVYSKADLLAEMPSNDTRADPPRLWVSSKTGAGLQALRRHLKERVGYAPAEGAGISARRRHLDALTRARAHLEAGLTRLHEERAGELLAEELRQAQTALGEITGEFTSEDLLARIFSRFCIGK